MGTSPSKSSQHIERPSTQETKNDTESDDVYHSETRSSQDDKGEDLDTGSFVFIDKEWSCSVSSAEEALSIEKYNDTPTDRKEINIQEDIEKIGTSYEEQTVQCSPEEHTNHEQHSDKVEPRIGFEEKSDPIDIIPNSCSVTEELPVTLKSNTEIQLNPSVDNFTPAEISLTRKEEWIKMDGCDSTLFVIYEIFSSYGSVSALAKTEDHIYVKFASWASIANVFDDIRNLKQVCQLNSIAKVDDNELKNYPERTEIYLDLPCFVVTYMKEYHELCKALNIVTMTANDNICLNAPKIQQVLSHIRASVSKGFQQCRLFPFGSHILGSCDRSDPLEIFVDVGDMYAGCHKQSREEQIDISKKIRKLISDDVVWYSHEESPVGIFYNKTVGLNCILNFNNGFGDRCTQLLRIFMDYDERFRVLYLMLDIWSKQCSLQGVSNGFNSYIVAVLLVFYLQVLPDPLLPPLKRIRTGRPVVIKGWDCTFIEEPGLLPRNECAMDLYSLLRGFFIFYGNYDWKRVVCPVLGRSIDRNVFSTPTVPFPDDPVFANYFRAISEKVPNAPHFDVSTSMCLQDFFNLSENITKGVSSDTLLRFQSLCCQSHKMIYTAESKISFGSHMLHQLPISPYHESDIRRQEQVTNNFRYPAKCGSVSDCTASSRSCSSSDQHESDHGINCICERCSVGTNQRQVGRQNWQQHPKRQASQRKENFYQDTAYFNEASNSRGRKSQGCNSYLRSYRGRFFWRNSAKNTIK